MDKAFVVFRDVEKRAQYNQFYSKLRPLHSLNYLYAPLWTALEELLILLWNLSRPYQVSVKNKVSTSLKFQGIYYVANTPDFTLKVLTKPTLSIVRCTKEKNKHPLKFNLF